MLSTTQYLYQEYEQGGKNVVNFKNFVPFHVKGEYTLDIDSEEDFEYAEFLMSQKKIK